MDDDFIGPFCTSMSSTLRCCSSSRAIDSLLMLSPCTLSALSVHSTPFECIFRAFSVPWSKLRLLPSNNSSLMVAASACRVVPAHPPHAVSSPRCQTRYARPRHWRTQTAVFVYLILRSGMSDFVLGVFLIHLYQCSYNHQRCYLPAIYRSTLPKHSLLFCTLTESPLPGAVKELGEN